LVGDCNPPGFCFAPFSSQAFMDGYGPCIKSMLFYFHIHVMFKLFGSVCTFICQGCLVSPL